MEREGFWFHEEGRFLDWKRWLILHLLNFSGQIDDFLFFLDLGFLKIFEDFKVAFFI